MLRLALVAAAAVSVYGAEHASKPGSITIDAKIMNIRAPMVNGDFVGHRNDEDTASLAKLKTAVDDLKSGIFSMEDSANTAKNVLASSSTMENSFDSIADLVDQNAIVVSAVGSMQVNMKAKTAGIKKAVDDAMEKTAGQFSELEQKLKKKVDENAAVLSTLQVTSTSNEELAAEIALMKASSTSVSDEINGVVDGEIKKMEGGLNNLMKVKRHIWSGGMKKTHQSGGWHDIAYDREEFNSAAPYFKKESNTRFKILIHGLYHFSYTWMSHCHWSHRHAHFYINGQSLIGNYHKWSQHWQTNHMDITWVVKPNSQVYMRVYGCNHAWHGSNDINSYNRIRVEYMGQLDKEKCSGIACDGH